MTKYRNETINHIVVSFIHYALQAIRFWLQLIFYWKFNTRSNNSSKILTKRLTGLIRTNSN